MTNAAVSQALENIYASLHNENEDIDLRIDELKKALGPEKTIAVDPARLSENTRQGRRMMQSYFKRRGITVTFSQE